MRIRISGRDAGYVAGDWTLDLSQEGTALVLTGFERKGDKGEPEKLQLDEAINLFSMISTSSRPELKRRIG